MHRIGEDYPLVLEGVKSGEALRVLSRKPLCGEGRPGLVGATDLGSRFYPGASAERLAASAILDRPPPPSPGSSAQVGVLLLSVLLPCLPQFGGGLASVRREHVCMWPNETNQRGPSSGSGQSC